MAEPPFIHLRDSQKNESVTPLVHYQYLDEQVPPHLSSQSRVLVVDLQSSTLVDKAFDFHFTSGRADSVELTAHVAQPEGNVGKRKTLILEGFFSPEEQAKFEESKHVEICRTILRARCDESGDPYEAVAPTLAAFPDIGLELFHDPKNRRSVQIVEGSTQDVRKFLNSIVEGNYFTEIQIINEGFPPFRTVTGCTPAKQAQWDEFEKTFPVLFDWVKGKPNLLPSYEEEFSSRSEHIRSLLFDQDLKGLSSVTIEKAESKAYKQELKAPSKGSGQVDLVEPVPGKRSVDLTKRDGGSREGSLEKFTISGYFPFQRSGSPPIRLSRENTNENSSIGETNGTVPDVLKDTGSERPLFASPPPRGVSPMPWTAHGGTNGGLPSGLIAHAYSPVPLGNRMPSHTSANSDNVPMDLNVYMEQFENHVQDCIRSAMASVKSQMEELAVSYKEALLEKLQARQPPLNRPRTPGTPHSNSFPFARTLSESRKLEKSRRIKRESK